MQFVSSFAPGRVELLGNHTDYNSGVVLSGALDLGLSAKGKRRDDGKVVLRTAGFPDEAKLELEALKPGDRWSDYPAGVAKVFKDAGYPVEGFEAEFTSTLPTGAGLSSSAAIEVSTAVLLKELFGFEVERLELAKLCRKAENEFVGVNCGLLDQVSSVFGRKGQAIYLDCRSETVSNVAFPAGVALLIIHSGVAHALTGGEYNERREQCFEAAKRLGVPALRDTTSTELEAADLPELVKRRARHIVGENERVFAAVEHLKAGEVAEFGALMTASHKSSIENFENSTPELDALVRLATVQPGVYGARLTGGGFGGAIVALVREEALDEAAQAIVEGYKKETGHTATAYRCHLGDGAILPS